jgi:hypothetical protein
MNHILQSIFLIISKKKNILKEINTTMKNAIYCIDNLNKYLESLLNSSFDPKDEYQTKDNKFNHLENLGKLFENISGYYDEKKFVFDFKLENFSNIIINEIITPFMQKKQK